MPEHKKKRSLSTPDARASEQSKAVTRIRRKYSTKSRGGNNKLLAAEIGPVKQMVAILKIAGYSSRQMALVIGISRAQVSDMLKEPDVIENIVLLRERIPAAATELMQGYMIEAVQALVDVMRSSNDDKNIIAAATEILDRGGIPKASRQERLNINEERTTITDDGLLDRLRQASPEVQEQAAKVIEDLEKVLAQASEFVDGEFHEEEDEDE